MYYFWNFLKYIFYYFLGSESQYPQILQYLDDYPKSGYANVKSLNLDNKITDI